MSEFPITTEQVQLFIYLGFYAVTTYLIVHFIKFGTAIVGKSEKKDKIGFVEKIKSWWKKRKELKTM